MHFKWLISTTVFQAIDSFFVFQLIDFNLYISINRFQPLFSKFFRRNYDQHFLLQPAWSTCSPRTWKCRKASWRRAQTVRRLFRSPAYANMYISVHQACCGFSTYVVVDTDVGERSRIQLCKGLTEQSLIQRLNVFPTAGHLFCMKRPKKLTKRHVRTRETRINVISWTNATFKVKDKQKAQAKIFVTNITILKYWNLLGTWDYLLRCRHLGMANTLNEKAFANTPTNK
jgi:hypothetical protein